MMLEPASRAISAPRQGRRPLVRLPHRRAKTGCLTCRQRKKKCDEIRPRCSGCRRNHESCSWPISTYVPHQTSTTSTLSPSFAINVHTGRACYLTPDSALLLSHYLSETAPMLATAPVEKNPFITHVVPLAYTDDLLMHSVLALGGTHLAFKKDSDVQIQIATWQHYSAVVSGLRCELLRLSSDNFRKTWSLLLVLLLVCHYEVGLIQIYILVLALTRTDHIWRHERHILSAPACESRAGPLTSYAFTAQRDAQVH